jgi:hypothetical protein
MKGVSTFELSLADVEGKCNLEAAFAARRKTASSMVRKVKISYLDSRHLANYTVKGKRVVSLTN